MGEAAFTPILDEPQRGQMLDLLAEGFPGIDIEWSSAFAAPPGKTGHGVLLLVDGRPEGGILMFERSRTINGVRRRVVNLSSWYIRPPYRTLAIRMMDEITADASAIYTIGSPIASVQKICLRVGFRYVSQGSIASVPLLNGGGVGGDTAVEPYRPGVLRDTDLDTALRDHGDKRHVAILLRRPAGVVPVLWQRGLKVRELAAARLLFAADHRAVRAALGAVHWHLLGRHGIVGLYLPRIAPYAGLRSLRKRLRGPSIVIKGDIADEDVDLLYSELLYLRPRVG
jgi:hypothetical protein